MHHKPNGMNECIQFVQAFLLLFNCTPTLTRYACSDDNELYTHYRNCLQKPSIDPCTVTLIHNSMQSHCTWYMGNAICSTRSRKHVRCVQQISCLYTHLSPPLNYYHTAAAILKVIATLSVNKKWAALSIPDWFASITCCQQINAPDSYKVVSQVSITQFEFNPIVLISHNICCIYTERPFYVRTVPTYVCHRFAWDLLCTVPSTAFNVWNHSKGPSTRNNQLVQRVNQLVSQTVDRFIYASQPFSKFFGHPVVTLSTPQQLADWMAKLVV